jgi:hypothetical protein
MRDYRMAHDPAILAPFSAAVEAFATRVAWCVSGALLAMSTQRIQGKPVDSAAQCSGHRSAARRYGRLYIIRLYQASLCLDTSACPDARRRYCGQVRFTTDRNPATGAPSLFGSTRSHGARLQAGMAVGATSLAVIGAMAWLSGRSTRRPSA